MVAKRIKGYIFGVLIVVSMNFYWNSQDRTFKDPRFHDLPYVVKQTSHAGIDWPKELSSAMINDIRYYRDVLLLATNKGLVMIDIDHHKIRRFQIHSDMPFEWWRSMDVSDNKVVSTTLVSNGSTGGTYAGSHVFDLDTLIPMPLEREITGQIFHNNLLYQLSDKRLLVRDPLQGFSTVRTIDLEPLVHTGCIFGSPLSTGRAIWVPTWGRPTSSHTIYSATKGKCGLIRIPDSGEPIKIIKKGNNAMAYHTTQYSYSDSDGLLLVHPTRAQRVSYYGEANNQWRAIDSSALAGTLSENYFWVGYRGVTGYARNGPKNITIRVKTALRPNRFVSAIAVRESNEFKAEVWIAFYVKHYSGDGYDIESSIERHIVDLQ